MKQSQQGHTDAPHKASSGDVLKELSTVYFSGNQHIALRHTSQNNSVCKLPRSTEVEWPDRIRAIEDRLGRLEGKTEANEVFMEEMRAGLMHSIEHVQSSLDDVHQALRDHIKAEDIHQDAMLRAAIVALIAIFTGLGSWVLYTLATMAK